MKKLIFAVLLTIISAPLSAYFYFEPLSIVLYPGALGKLYSHTFDTSPGADIEPRGGASYAAGASVDLFFTNSLALTGGAYYDKCVEEFQIFGFGKNTMKADFTYLTTPIGFHYYFYDLHFLGAGCYYGRHIDSEYSENSDGVESVDTTHMNDDIGIWAQLGYAIEITERINCLIYIEGKRSLVGVYKNSESSITNLKRYELNVGTAFGYRI